MGGFPKKTIPRHPQILWDCVVVQDEEEENDDDDDDDNIYDDDDDDDDDAGDEFVQRFYSMWPSIKSCCQLKI